MEFKRLFAHIVNCRSPNETKLIIRLLLRSIHLPEHKFTLNSIYNYRDKVGNTTHYLLDLLKYFNERATLFKNLQSVEQNIVDRNESQI